MVHVDYNFAARNKAFFRGSELVVAQSISADIVTEMARVYSGFERLTVVSDDQFIEYVDEYYADIRSNMDGISEVLNHSGTIEDAVLEAKSSLDLLENDDAPTIRFLNAILLESIKRQASDVHVEVFEAGARIRLRVDGALTSLVEPPAVLAAKLVSRIKVLAKLDIAEKRLPQDGRISLKLANRSIDLRVSTMPAIHGERIVLRVLEKQTSNLDLKHLGLKSGQREVLDHLLKRPNGIILVTGPTGSGKTTTLYAALSTVATTERNVMTVEDPVEYDLPGVSQTQVSSKTGFTFAKGLKAILRQDPDVVLVGEIRDSETARIAVQASLTGHLVLSTLHTNSAIGAITRLIDLGVESFLLSSSLRGVMAQRLVRVLCKSCRVTEDISDEQASWLRDQGVSIPKKVYRGKGCVDCTGSGYRGRVGLYELVEIDTGIRQLIHDGASEIDLERYIRSQSAPLKQSGAQLVADGETTFEEVLKVLAE